MEDAAYAGRRAATAQVIRYRSQQVRNENGSFGRRGWRTCRHGLLSEVQASRSAADTWRLGPRARAAGIDRYGEPVVSGWLSNDSSLNNNGISCRNDMHECQIEQLNDLVGQNRPTHCSAEEPASQTYPGSAVPGFEH